MTKRTHVNGVSGRVKFATMVFLAVLAGSIYYGVEVGGVYFRKMKLEEAISQQLSFAGQVEDSAIRQQIQIEARELKLPPAAQQVGLVRTQRPRAIHVTISYKEPVNLLFRKTEIPVQISVNRSF